MCRTHYTQTLRAEAPPCTVDDCDNPALARGLCARHYDAGRSRRRANDDALVSSVLTYVTANPGRTTTVIKKACGKVGTPAVLDRLVAEGALTVTLVKPLGRGRASRTYHAPGTTS